jgi:DNA repair protein RadD
MLAVTYYGALSDSPFTEYLPVLHDGYAANKAMSLLLTMARQGGVSLLNVEGLDAIANEMNTAQAPSLVEFKKDGKFYRVIRREW